MKKSIKLRWIVYSICLISILFYCHHYRNECMNKLSSVNKGGLFKMLKLKSNSLSNPINKYTLLNADFDSVKIYVRKISELKVDYPDESNDELLKKVDSLKKMIIIRNNTEYIKDDNYINKKFLTHNKELAEKALAESSWEDEISPEIFQEYILPYKLNMEIVDTWRDTLYKFHQKLIEKDVSLKNLDSLYKFHLTETYNSLSSHWVFKKHFPAESNFTWLDLTMEGDCQSRCKYVMYYLLAAGAPATFDYILSWGNRSNAKHFHVGLANRKTQVKKLLENNNNPNNLIDDLNAAMTVSGNFVFPTSEIPKGFYVQYEKTIPKVYRRTWSSQDNMVKLIKSLPIDEIDFNLIQPNMLDVTSEYLKTEIVRCQKHILDPYKVIYLTTFNRESWVPVAFSKFNIFGHALFEDVGKNIVYMPMVMKDNQMSFYGSPFILKNDGVKDELIPNYEKLIKLNLIRKYPLFSYGLRHLPSFKGTELQCSNSEDFKNLKVLYTIKKYPFYSIVVNDLDTISYKYYRLVNETNSSVSTQYFDFYTLNSNDSLIKVNRRLYRKNGMLYAKLNGSFQIKKILILPKNDMNYIVPGLIYELLYWDNGWISAGKKTAEESSLHYTNIPSETLYWLRCLSKGTEERIFTYENGNQIWW